MGHQLIHGSAACKELGHKHSSPELRLLYPLHLRVTPHPQQGSEAPLSSASCSPPIFHETDPWCQKGRGPLSYSTPSQRGHLYIPHVKCPPPQLHTPCPHSPARSVNDTDEKPCFTHIVTNFELTRNQKQMKITCLLAIGFK